MGSLFGGAAGGGKSNPADWDQIKQLMELTADLNRYGQHGMFTSTDWTEGEDGRWTQTQSANPALQAGVDQLMQSMSSPAQQWSAPSQFNEMLDAKMANQMGRQGILNEGQQRQPQDFGQQVAQQPGRQQTPWNTPPPQQGSMIPPGAGQGQQIPQQQPQVNPQQQQQVQQEWDEYA